MKNKLFIILLLIIFIPTIVKADIGPKPSITIKLKNMKDTNYKIDLLSDFSENKNNINEIVDHYSKYKNEPIYKYHEKNMYATCLRNFLLHGDIEGNSTYTHYFTYFGVPDKFKVIIQMPDGTIKVSDLLVKDRFYYNVTIDVNNMKVVNEYKDININKRIKILLLTVITELMIAILFKIKKYHVIIIVNVITNILLQLLLSNNLSLFINYEMMIVIIELLIYNKFINEIKKEKLLIYTILANIVTAILTFVV